MTHRNISQLIISAGSSIREAVEAIDANGVRGVFVCDEDGELSGIVMDAEIRRMILKNIDLENSVKTIMHTQPFTLSIELPLRERELAAVRSGKLLVPVVDEGNRVVDYVYLTEIMAYNGEHVRNRPSHEQGLFPPGKVLIIGGAGYIGSALSTLLLARGYHVRCLDLLLYSKDPLVAINGNSHFEFVRGDCRNEDILARSMEGVDAVVHLGEIVGDPACQINEDFTIDTNYLATAKVVDLCVQQGVPRFVFTSSCSVYGCNDHVVDEGSELNPVSLYARCKIESERAILAARTPNLCSTILRLGTVHGLSLRQRFDLVVNLLTIKALGEGRITIFGGNQWRPFLSVADVCRGIAGVLRAPAGQVCGEVFNLGDSRENYTINQVGELIREEVPQAAVETTQELDDPRNYRVSFDKINRRLGFSCAHTVRDTVRDLISAYRDEARFHDYADPKYYNVLTLKSPCLLCE
jgi:nucleoside-diphosphate-sugar epimerase